MNSRVFNRLGFNYLPESDRYLSKLPDAQIGYAVIGCGTMGQEHIRNALLEGRSFIAGVYDPAPKSLEVARKIVTDSGAELPVTYTDLEQICVDDRVDAIFICSPNFTHLAVLQQIAECDKAIFLEKPLATSVADAMRVSRIVQQRSALTRIGLQYRYKAIYAEAIHEVLQRQTLGSVKSVAMVEHRFPFLDKVGQWNKFNKYTGGTLVEKCCHYFDLLNLFAQAEPRRVFAMGNQAVNFTEFTYAGAAADGLDQAQVMIEYSNGVLGSFNLCMFASGAREELTICGDSGRLFASETARLGEQSRNQLDIWRGDHGASRSTQPMYSPQIHAAGHHGSTFYEHMAFVDDLLGGTNNGPDLAAAMMSVVVGAAAQHSIALGEPVEIASYIEEQAADL